MKVVVDIPDSDYFELYENYKMLERKGAVKSDTLEQIAFNAVANGEIYHHTDTGIRIPSTFIPDEIIRPIMPPQPDYSTTYSTFTYPYEAPWWATSELERLKELLSGGIKND